MYHLHSTIPYWVLIFTKNCARQTLSWLIILLFMVLCVCVLRRVWLFVTPWTVAHQAPLSMGLSRQENWSQLQFHTPGDPPDPGIEHMSFVSPSYLCSNEESKAHARYYFEVPQLAEQGVNPGLLSSTNYTFRQVSHNTVLLTKNFCSFNSLENCLLRELM